MDYSVITYDLPCAVVTEADTRALFHDIGETSQRPEVSLVPMGERTLKDCALEEFFLLIRETGRKSRMSLGCQSCFPVVLPRRMPLTHGGGGNSQSSCDVRLGYGVRKEPSSSFSHTLPRSAIVY